MFLVTRFSRLVFVALVATSATVFSTETTAADAPPKLIKRVDPDYPRDLEQKGINGRVTVELSIDAQGKVVDARVLAATDPAFETPALAAVRRWKFSPARRGGAAVATTVRMPVIFGMDLFDDRLLNEQKSRAAAPITPPAPLAPLRAAYPYAAALAGTTGDATVRFTVDEAGRVRDAEVLRSTNLEFGAAALAAIEAARFTPAQQSGAAVQVRLEREIHFGPDAAETSLDAEARALTNRLGQGQPPPTARELDAPLQRRNAPVPRLPEALAREGRGGSATIEIFIGSDGRVVLTRVVKADDERLGWAAATALAQWTFDPPLKGGQAIAVRLGIPVSFPAPAKETAAAN